MVKLRVTHSLAEGMDVHWRAYTKNGKQHGCGNSSRGLREANKKFRLYDADNIYTVFAWMTKLQEDWDVPFSPSELLPIPTSHSLETEEEEVVFAFDEKNRCIPSHFVLYVLNETGRARDLKIGSDKAGEARQQWRAAPLSFEQEFVFAIPNKDALSSLTLSIRDVNKNWVQMKVFNGDTATLRKKENQSVLFRSLLSILTII